MEATLEQRLDRAIRQNPYLAGKRLRVERDDDRVVLRGSVETFFQKQMAQEAVRRVDGVTRIDNELEVTWR